MESPLLEYRMAVYLFGTVFFHSCVNVAVKTTAREHKKEFICLSGRRS